jgi:hypothetical protein
MAMTDERDVLDCRTYTRARKHPLVIGKIGGWALPTPLSPTQLLVLLGSFGLLLYTRAVWGHLGALANLLVQGGVPLTLTWAVRHLRIEGRPPLRTAAGLLSLATSPKGGVAHGRPHHAVRVARATGTRLFFFESGPVRATDEGDADSEGSLFDREA